MKKLMIVAAAAFGMAAFGDIESSNIVGYANGKETVDQYNFVAVGFNTVGYNTFDIQQIKITGDGIGWGGENFSVWAGGPDVVEGTGFFLWDASMDPEGEATECYWGDDNCAKANFSAEPGQGVVIQCGEGLLVTVSGQVPSGNVTLTTVDQYNFIANPFPTALDIQNIKLSGDGIGWGGENFSVWAGGPDVVAGSGFFLWDASMDPEGEATGCYWGDDSCNKAVFQIEVGQAVVIQSGADLEVTIEAPYEL